MNKKSYIEFKNEIDILNIHNPRYNYSQLDDIKDGCMHMCSLSKSMDKCCACSDKRPIRTKYIVYIDGRGNVPLGNRRMHYCPTCKYGIIKLVLPVWTPNTNKFFPRYIQRVAYSIMSLSNYPLLGFYRIPVDVIYIIISYYIRRLFR